MTARRLAFAAVLAAAWLPAAVRADAPSLQVAPLQYAGNLHPGRVESGYVDVSNPTDTNVQITATVQGFRQTGTGGDLQFFYNPDLSSGIQVGLTSFTLGPREALRDVFSIDPSKLPGGGVYAAIFFRTQPPGQTSSSSFVAESANVGTLLILTNGGPGVPHGAVSSLHLPFWQLGSGLQGGRLAFQNTDHSRTAVGFDPRLSATVLPWGHAGAFTSGLVLPGVTRDFGFTRPGSYFGLLPVRVADTESGAHRTTWVFALTGFYRWLLPLFVILLLAVIKFKPYQAIKLPSTARATQPTTQPEPELTTDHHAPEHVAQAGSDDPEPPPEGTPSEPSADEPPGPSSGSSTRRL